MKKIWFDEAWEDYTYWQTQDKKTLKRINILLRGIERGNFDGIGKPEPLRGDMSGFWSRRINEVNRLVYRINGDVIEIISCKGHYELSESASNFRTKIKAIWKEEEKAAHIHGWDFSHIHGRYEEERDLPWDYEKVIRQYLRDDMDMLDYDTGGGEFLLSLRHPFHRTAATEGYRPNVELCEERLLPLGIAFRECDDPADIPFKNESFDVIINRHGSFHAKELYRLLKKGGLFITEQVGGDNDRDLVEMVLPNTERPFPDLNLKEQKKVFKDAGFQIIEEAEAYRPIRFYDVGAFVWFARVIEWEFPEFSVDGCFEQLIKMQEKIEEEGSIEGTIHRYLIVAKK